ncbi:MAG: tRNA (adenosine(37)-N6)-dimethylallyltransferase MiaA [bacterium]|nr:tRNA (adenosine(37)-N6)-dimethylallyltransferase MiaA [bacterium]
MNILSRRLHKVSWSGAPRASRIDRMNRLLMQNTSTPPRNQHETRRRALFLALAGPTASGKTDLSLALADALGAEILCVDAMQVYQGLDVGSAKPAPDERARVVHHGLDLVSPLENYSASRFAAEMEPLLEDAVRRERPLILCGGTGLYFRALLEGLFEAPDPDPGLREALKRRALAEGGAALYAELEARDPVAAAGIHPNDERRVIRALELMEQTGETVSALRARQKRKTWADQTVYFGPRRDPGDLANRIQIRTRWMFDNGLVDETRRLIDMGCDESHTSLQALGYKECRDFLLGRMTREEAAEAVERGTRQYAKRQMTWFRRQFDVNWIDWKKEESLEEKCNICLKLWINLR